METSKAAANPTIRGEIEHVKAGRLGEDLVQKELEKLGTVRSGVRIPGTNGRRNEIDLVLQTRSHIYLFEVKYWSGSVELTPDGHWKQIRLSSHFGAIRHQVFFSSNKKVWQSLLTSRNNRDLAESEIKILRKIGTSRQFSIRCSSQQV